MLVKPRTTLAGSGMVTEAGGVEKVPESEIPPVPGGVCVKLMVNDA